MAAAELYSGGFACVEGLRPSGSGYAAAAPDVIADVTQFLPDDAVQVRRRVASGGFKSLATGLKPDKELVTVS